jgi:heme o synthase
MRADRLARGRTNGVEEGAERMRAAIRMTVSLLKLRIGMAVAASAMAGIAAAHGPAPQAWQLLGLALAVLGASGAAGAFNHYYERDLDRCMHRTCARPFATGAFGDSRWWLVGFLALLVASLAVALVAAGPVATFFVLLGAFTYGVVYTVWLKRRTPWNIVVGGLAGSFAVLAGAAMVDPVPQPFPVVLALALFLWTPPHFWSLAVAGSKDYARAGVPMLPVVAPARVWKSVILAHTATLVMVSLIPLLLGSGIPYALGACCGGALFLWTSVALYRDPSPRTAIRNFLASLVQLGLLVAGAVLDALV